MPEHPLRRSIAATAGYEKKKLKPSSSVKQLEALVLARKTRSCLEDPMGKSCHWVMHRPKGKLP